MSKCLALDTMTVSFKDGSMLQITANHIKHSCLDNVHYVEASYDIEADYELLHTYKFKDTDVEEIIQSWHMRKAKEVK